MFSFIVLPLDHDIWNLKSLFADFFVCLHFLCMFWSAQFTLSYRRTLTAKQQLQSCPCFWQAKIPVWLKLSLWPPHPWSTEQHLSHNSALTDDLHNTPPVIEFLSSYSVTLINIINIILVINEGLHWGVLSNLVEKKERRNHLWGTLGSVSDLFQSLAPNKTQDFSHGLVTCASHWTAGEGHWGKSCCLK